MLQTNFYGDNNLGMYAKATDKFLLIGSLIEEKLVTKISEKLNISPFRTTISNSDFVGIFSCLNSSGLIIPHIATDDEVKQLENFAKKSGMNLAVLKTKFSAIGNLVLCNDNGAIVSKNIKQRNKKMIEDCLGVETVYSSIARMPIVGSSGTATNKGCLLHRDAVDDEIK